jgi:hypothetical protein
MADAGITKERLHPADRVEPSSGLPDRFLEPTLLVTSLVHSRARDWASCTPGSSVYVLAVISCRGGLLTSCGGYLARVRLHLGGTTRLGDPRSQSRQRPRGDGRAWWLWSVGTDAVTTASPGATTDEPQGG